MCRFFFCYSSELQQCLLDAGIYLGKEFSQIYIDFEETTWFDTLSLCYLLMFLDQANHLHHFDIRFFFSCFNNLPVAHSIFRSFLNDNGFLAQMRNVGQIQNLNFIAELKYSDIHKCV